MDSSQALRASVTAFLDWPDWPRVLGEVIDWAAGVRPLQEDSPTTTPTTQPLTEAEISDLSLGMGSSDTLLHRASATALPATT